MNISRLMCNKSMPDTRVGNLVAWTGYGDTGLSIETRAYYGRGVWATALFIDMRFENSEPSMLPSASLWKGACNNIPKAWTEVPT